MPVENRSQQVSSMIGATLTRAGVVGSNFASMLAIGAMAAPDTYGNFVFLWSLALLASASVSFGAPQFLLKEMAICRGETSFDRHFAIRLIVLYPALLSAILMVSFAAFYGVISSVFQSLTAFSIPMILLVGTLGFLMNLNNCFSSLLHGLDMLNLSMFLKDAGPQLFALVISLALFVTTGVDLVLLLSGIVILMAISLTVVGLIFLRKNRDAALIGKDGRKQTFTLYYWGGTITGIFWAQIDILIGASLMTAEQLGIYNIIRRICNFVTLPLSIATWLTVGRFARAFASEDNRALKETLRFSLLLSNGLGVVLTLVVIGLIQPIQAFYGFPSDTSYATIWAVLIIQAFTNLIFAPSTTMAQTSGLESSAMYARILGIAAFGLFVLFFSVWVQAELLTVTALSAATVVLNLYVWNRVRQRFGIDSSVFGLFFQIARNRC